MREYIIRRLLIFLPTLLIISFLAFYLSRITPGDPVLIALGQAAEETDGTAIQSQAYVQMRQQLGLDKPLFYFAVMPYALPDTLYRIIKPAERAAAEALCYQTGNWQAVNTWHQSLHNLLEHPNDITSATRRQIAALLTESRISNLQNQLSAIEKDTILAPIAAPLKHLITQETQWKLYIPTIRWYGFDNQYHRWLLNLLKLDFGISFIDKRPVRTRLLEALAVSFWINFIAIICTYVVALPLGVWSARNENSIADKIVTIIIFILYALPTFWVATLLIFFLGSGGYFPLFPNSGLISIGYSDEWGFWQKLTDRIWHLILPLICYIYGGIAFLSRQMRSSMRSALHQDYIRTAIAKGLTEKQVIWRHAFRNSLLPVLTLAAAIFPALVGGSIILETIFSLPGMGMLSYQSLSARDYPVIVSVFLLAGIMTQIGMLLVDILYAIVDPRISFKDR
jgi:peptide/nickel transport system permease protein